MTHDQSYPGNVGALLAGLSRVLRVMESARQPHNKSLMSIWEDDVKDIKAVESFLENIPLVLAQAAPDDPVTWEDIATQLFAVDGNGFWEDRTPIQEEAYSIRAKAIAELFSRCGRPTPPMSSTESK